MLNKSCQTDIQCRTGTNHSVCLQVTLTSSYCKCKTGYRPLPPDQQVCTPAPVLTTSPLYPTSLASLSILLLLLAFLLAFILKLFSKARWPQRPLCPDAALTPIIKLDGKESEDLISTSSPVSESRTYSPGPVLTPDELRKMSLLSSLSVTIPLDQDFDVRAVSPTGCHLSPEHIIPHVSSLTTPPSPLPPVGNIEHSVTIIPNLRAKVNRRKSMADYAFPELHPEARLESPSKNLLIYTQTGVDPNTGRRHSVSIPLLPPSSSRADTKAPLVTIQRKGSHHGPRTSRNMESIVESGSKMTVSQETSMDCLRVPGLSGQQRRQRRMSPRQNSLPARPSRGSSPASASRSQGSLRSSVRRPDKQDFYQFLDSAIAH